MRFTVQFLLCICMVNLPLKLEAAKKEKPCPPLPYASLENGKITALSRQRYRFRCDDGYFLAGREEIRCYNGKWTSTRVPKCYKSEDRCDKPDKISNGDVHGDDRNEGAVIQYMCHPGYVLLGTAMRTCSAARVWTGITPACLDEDEPLQNLANRLNKQFVNKMGSFSSSSLIQGRHLDSASTREGLELVILIDRSSSVDPVDFATGKEFVKFLFEEFGVKNVNNTSGTRAAVIAFGSKVEVVFNLNNATIVDRFAANKALDHLQSGGGGTAMEPALTSVFIHVQPLMRKRAKKALFLITDGEPNIGSPDITPEHMAGQLKEHADFEIFTVGIGKEVNRQLLSRIASLPLLSHVFILNKYSDLEGVMRLIRNQPTEAPPISPERCGYIDENKPKPKHWPWVAAVYVNVPGFSNAPGNEENETRSPSTTFSLCGGTLICSQWVLTSASCFYHTVAHSLRFNAEEVFVVLGEDDLTKDDKTQMNFYSSHVVIHPEFKTRNMLRHNLALVKLNDPAPIAQYRPVCLPPTGKTRPLHLDLNLNTTIAGWGLPQMKEQSDEITGATVRLQMATRIVSLAEEDECRRFNGNFTEGAFCAGFGTISTCVGDLGSAIIAVDPDTNLNHILGVLSKRSECHHGYSQYIELTKYVHWIGNVTDNCYFKHWV